MPNNSKSVSRFLSNSGESENSKSWIREIIRQLEERKKKLRIVRKECLKQAANFEKEIEATLEGIIALVEERRKALRLQLEEIKRERIMEWDRQVKYCKLASKNLQIMKNVGVNWVDGVSAYSNSISERIGCIKPTALHFESDEDVLNQIENLGKFSLISNPVRRKITIKGQNELLQPIGVCSDVTGRILVADCCNSRIQVFNEFGDFLFQFGEFGADVGEFHHPTGITVDKKLRIVVADRDNHRVQVFTYKGVFLLSFGEKGSKASQFRFPWDVAVNNECDILVSDTGNRRIQLFASHGQFLRQFSFAANLNVFPFRIAFKADGCIQVTDSFSKRLITVSEDFLEAKIIQKDFSL